MQYIIKLECTVEADDVNTAAEHAHEWMQDNIHRATVTVTDEAGLETDVDLWEVVSG